MAQIGRRNTTGGFIADMFLIVAIILATKVSQVKTELPTEENCPNLLSLVNDNGTCVFSDHCSKVECTSPPDINTGQIKHMAVQALVCNQSVKANVSLESSSVKWSHTFKDGEKVALPDALKPSDAPSSVKQFLKVELARDDPYTPYVHFKLVLMFDYGFMNYNITFFEGDLEAAECESHVTVFPTPMVSGGDGGDCPNIQLPDGSDGTCVLDDHCSKVICTSPPDSVGPFSHMDLTVQAFACRHQPVEAKVSLDSPSVKWSHAFKDGEKVALPNAMIPPDASADLKIFLEAELTNYGGNVHFKLLLLFESEPAKYNVTFLEGDLHARTKCTADHSKQCPAVNFMPGITQDKKDASSTFKCVSSNQCSKVTCVVATADHKLTVGFEVDKCGQSLSGKVTLKEPDVLDWSQSLGDGEKAKLPVVPGSFTGDVQVSHASLFIKVGLQEMKGNKVNFTVSIVGQITIEGETAPVNVMLLEGELATSTDDCSMGSWFSRQSSGVKAAVIIVPLLVVALLVFVVALICYKKRRDGKRFLVDIFYGKDKDGMQRLSEEL